MISLAQLHVDASNCTGRVKSSTECGNDGESKACHVLYARSVTLWKTLCERIT